MQRIIIVCLCLVLVPAVVLSYPWQDESDGFEDDGQANEGTLQLFHNLERKSFCAGWGDYCTQKAKVKFAQCCEGLRCVCNVWKNNRCECKSPSIFGR